MTTESWVLEVRNEFPGLVAAKNWILCDSPGGTQVHLVDISNLLEYHRNECLKTRKNFTGV